MQGTRDFSMTTKMFRGGQMETFKIEGKLAIEFNY